MDLKNILPKDGPPLSEVNKYIEKYKNDLIVIKYGGNVLIDRSVFNNFITDLFILNKLGLSTVVVHGGGPRIKRELEKSNIQSKFIRGLRVTDKSIINIVESVLIDFNDDILQNLKKRGSEGVSIHTKNNNIIEVIPEAKELGFVGIPSEINKDSINKTDRIMVIDDLIATGGTALATSKLISKSSSKKINFVFVIELEDLPGVAKIKKLGHAVKTLCSFKEEER